MNTTFSDDTTSGRWAQRLRGLRRITLVSRAEDENGFDWLETLKRSIKVDGPEIKSSDLLPLLDENPRLRTKVLNHVEGYSIFIVDFQGYREKLLDPLITRLAPIIPKGQDPYKFVWELPNVRSRAQLLLRQILLKESVLGRLESLIEWSANPLGLRLDEGLAEHVAGPVPAGLTSKASLQTLSERDLAALLARLGAAVGDVLSVSRQRESFISFLDSSNYFASPFLAVRELSRGLETHRVFDVGSATVWEELKAAHLQIARYVEQRIHHRLVRTVRTGVLVERPSHLELGIQAADLAVAIAAREYEGTPDGSSVSRAVRLKTCFSGVCLNGEWL